MWRAELWSVSTTEAYTVAFVIAVERVTILEVYQKNATGLTNVIFPSQRSNCHACFCLQQIIENPNLKTDKCVNL